MKKTSQVAARRSLPVGATLCGIAVAVLLASGCASAHPAQHGTPTAKRTFTSTVMHWGSFFGGLKGNFDVRTSPVPVTLPGPVAEIGTSNSTEYALLTDGTLWAWGLGTQGQLGDGGRANSFGKAVQVQFPRGVRIASIPTDVMPYDTALAVDTRGHAWGWGRNAGGELCRGDRQIYRTPVRIPLHHVTALAGASGHAIYDSRGTLYACGQNLDGDLGTGRMSSTTRPVRVARLDGSKVVELVASFANSGALLANGEYYDWGYDRAGQLGDGRIRRGSDVPVRVPLRSAVRQVAQGGSLWDNGQTLVILADGSVWAWGNDHAGQLGNHKTRRQPSPVRIHPPAGVTYQSLATGSATSYALTTLGAVYAWGVSHVGQVGNGGTQTALAPVLIVSGATSISATANNVAVAMRHRV